MLRKKKPENSEKPVHSEQYLCLRKAYYDMQNNSEWLAIHNLMRIIARDKQIKLSRIDYWDVLYSDLFHSDNGTFEYRYNINGYIPMSIIFDRTKYIVSFECFPHKRKDYLIFDHNSTTGLRLCRIINATNKKLNANNPQEAMVMLQRNASRKRYIGRLQEVERVLNLDKRR